MKDTWTLKDVRKTFPELSYRSLQVWVQKGVILPAEAARKRGAASRFDFLNMIEIGMVMQLVKYGYDSHYLLPRLMARAKSGKMEWIDDWKYKYNCFLLVKDFAFSPRQPAPEPVLRADGTVDEEATAFKLAQQKPTEAWAILKHEEMVGTLVAPDFSGALIVDIRLIKAYVEAALR